jgi:hypothetical protein
VKVTAVVRVCVIASFAATLALGQTARSPGSATNESTRLGAEYFVQRSGASWAYQLAKSKGRVSISAFVDWKAQVSIALGKWVGGATWRVKDGAWFERTTLRSDHEALVLPATMSRGTRWQAPASVERGGGVTRVSSFEVLALEAQVELPTGVTVDHCLAVLESAPEGGDAFIHYYAPNVGKVAVQGPEGWVYRLVEFHSGGKGHSE